VRIFSRSRASPGAGTRVRVLCFAHAGAGAALFRTWPEFLPEGVELACPTLPGREGRAAELPLSDMQAVVAAVIEQVLPLPDVPYCLFGHSLGAFVAFDLAHQLERRGAPLPRHLFVAAQRSPRLAHPQPTIYQLPDAEFLEGVHLRHGALPAALLEDDGMKSFLTRLLRADFTLVEAYRCAAVGPLSCAMTVFGGREDTAVPSGLLQRWAEESTGACEIVLVPGGHFFFKSNPREFFAAFSARLATPMHSAQPH
jgi:medium-chain acyl-[acyl-carrier-protein] hydrolase